MSVKLPLPVQKPCERAVARHGEVADCHGHNNVGGAPEHVAVLRILQSHVRAQSRRQQFKSNAAAAAAQYSASWVRGGGVCRRQNRNKEQNCKQRRSKRGHLSLKTTK